ncbi:Isy1-domain-containing protein [Fomitiporia mediterranea MF3/22]|uniref:Isy1-domain-containing protein n=1 Tax=Fomitiporia mediterranea (strain MF3/22) TaxID=694068 RepID=UPI0004409162|nr:Isy1-domain-containing protein [Fomitiporia mediterranea MF3/22]EJD01865.1 Isy1-domain-containing protein [Fomitiporia mediterranea MF3/22]
MARNEEKAQSMLYRFREAQAAELGLGTRSDRRPRMASACKSLRECERWRGEILREISRKVSKIQDAGLTDYEVRDVNDEINKLLREKRHWENQIVALGGANYRRNVAMLDDEGKEVPGTKGYKYFGRAKELPGVKELFQGRKKEQDEEDKMHAFYKKFTGQGPSYYGDLDEKDGELLKYERSQEEEEWEEAYSTLREVLGIPEDEPVPPMPGRDKANPLSTTTHQQLASGISDATKRKAPDGDMDMVAPSSISQPSDASTDATKRPKLTETQDDVSATNGIVTTQGQPSMDTAIQSAKMAAAFIPFLAPEDLLPPKLPTKDEMEGVLLELRKRALVEEYFGE